MNLRNSGIKVIFIAMLLCVRVAADVVETLNCSSCCVTFSDVDQLAEHSARQCVTSQVDGGQCSSELGERDDRVDCAASSGNAPAADAGDDSGRESTANTSNVNDVNHDVDVELDTAADDFTQPQLPQSSMRPSPSFDADNDNDDEQFDASDDYTLHSMTSSQSTMQLDKVYAAETDDTVTGRQRLSVVEGHVMNDGVPSPKTSSSTLTNVSQLIDNNVSPASKIAMLESVVYALHQQQMFQLELIEALRRQLATALAASSSRPADDNTNATLDLTLPRSSETTVLDHGSSLSSLMRLSAGVDYSRRAPPAGVHSPSTSPTTLSGSMVDGHDAAMSSAWPTELAINKSRIPPASLPSPLLATPKHGAALADLSLFRKGE